MSSSSLTSAITKQSTNQYTIPTKLTLGTCGITGGYAGEGPNLSDTAKPILVHVMSTCKIIVAKSNKTAAGCDVCTLGETAKNAARGIPTGTGPDAANTGSVLILIIESVAITEGVRGGATPIVSYNFR